MADYKKYSALRGQMTFIARACGCHETYVQYVLNGRRAPKTNRATMAQKVIEVADQLLAIHNNQNR